MMMRPKFEFLANSEANEDTSGVAVWRYMKLKRGEEVEVIVRQRFDSFLAAHEINNMLDEAWRAGEAAGYDDCQRKVLAAM